MRRPSPGWSSTKPGLSWSHARAISPSARAAWSKFHHRLANTFDGTPLIRSVAVSSCATLTAEPFVQSPSLTLNKEMLADGWTDALQQQCLRARFWTNRAGRRKPIDYAFNPFVSYTPGKAVGTQDPQFLNAVMPQCAELRRVKRRSCILSNHAFTARARLVSRSAPPRGAHPSIRR